MLPILPRILDQENSGTPKAARGKTVVIYEDKQMAQDIRTPLQNLNQQRRRSTAIAKPQHAQYSQITPFDTPVAKAPKRKSAAPKPSQPKFDENVNETEKDAAGASSAPMLNELVLQHAQHLVKAKEQEKDKEIQKLHDFYKKCLSTIEKNKQELHAGISMHTDTQTSAQTETEMGASNSGEESGGAASITPELEVGEQFAFSDMSTIMVEEVPSTSCVDSGCSPIRFDGGEEVSAYSAVDMETWMTPVKTLDTSLMTSPVVQIDKAIETKVESCEAETETDTVQMISRSAMTVGIETREEGVGTEHKEYSDTHTSVTPVKYANTSTCYTPVKHHEMETSMTPVRQVTMETAMTPVRQVTMETAMTPVHNVNIETCMTPVHHVSMETTMTPVKLLSECVGTVTIETSDVGVGTGTAQVSDSQTSTSPVKTQEFGMKTEPVGQNDVEVSTTPVKTCSVNTMVTPVKVRTCETSMSPATVVHQGVGTDAMLALKHQSTQISSDHTECVPQEYRQMFQENRQSLREAEAQLEVYLRLKDQVDEASSLQEELFKNIERARDGLRRKSEKLKAKSREMQSEHEDWEERMKENSERMKENESRMKKCEEERHQMALTYGSLAQGKEKAELALKQECEAHTRTLEDLEFVSMEMSQLGNEHNQTKEQFGELEMRLQEVSESRDESAVRCEAQAADLQLLQEKLQSEESRAETAQNYLQIQNNRHQQEILNLKRVIDMRTAETRNLEDELRRRLSSAVESQEFLEQENQVIREDLCTAQNNVTKLLAQLNASREDVLNLTVECNTLSDQNTAVRREMSELQNELDHTKTHAHLMLLDQSSEIQETVKALDFLAQCVKQLDVDIEDRLKAWAEENEEPASSGVTGTKKSDDRRSFVASIMDAIHNAATPSPHHSESLPMHDEPSTTPADKSTESPEAPQVTIGSSEGSAFKRVQPQSSNEATSLAASNTSQTSGAVNSVERTASTSSDSSSKALYEQVYDIKTIVYNVMSNLKILGDTVQHKVSSLHSKIQKAEAGNKSCEREKVRVARKHTEKVTELNLQIKDLEKINRELQASLNKNRELMPQKAQEKCMKLKSELDKVYEKLKNQTEENKILSDALESGIENCTDENQKKLIKENAAFKKELHQWKSRFYKEQETAETKLARLRQTAQQELETFHAAYESLKKIVMKHSAAVILWPERDELEDMGVIAPGSPNLTYTVIPVIN